MYYLLTESFKEQYKELVKIILDAVPADKIYLLGSTLMTRRTETIFMTDAPSCRYVGHYYVLVLVKDKTNCRTVQDTIENSCNNFIPVTAIALYTKQFNEWLSEGKQFAITVNRLAVQLNGAGEKETIPIKTPEPELKDAMAESIFNEVLNMVTEFLAGADLYFIREQNKMCAFMLHQAAEHGLHTILKVKAGLYLNTHNIDKLLRYCSMVSYELPAIFSKSNEKNERLIQLLNKAYIHARYKEDYSVNSHDLVAITERVKELQNLMLELCTSELKKDKQ
jgi:HEPN domain-containing protein